ncbi:c-type cytochrome [Pseudomonas sp. LRF_L74]|uniref:c-type cytochrome n=1 Tax=Pseudomonas sp. LRF_L74 TaxID=3369422 RepID=UPI003F6041B5
MIRRITLLFFLAVVLAGCGGVDPNSPQGRREAIFKQMLHESEDLGGMLRGRIAFDSVRFNAGATRLDELSRQPWQYFPEPSDGKQGEARTEVWQQQARFQLLARQLEEATAALATPAQPLNAETAEPLVRAVENACEACHREFRAY